MIFVKMWSVWLPYNFPKQGKKRQLLDVLMASDKKMNSFREPDQTGVGDARSKLKVT